MNIKSNKIYHFKEPYQVPESTLLGINPHGWSGKLGEEVVAKYQS